jgi:hypothetical protein
MLEQQLLPDMVGKQLLENMEFLVLEIVVHQLPGIKAQQVPVIMAPQALGIKAQQVPGIKVPQVPEDMA